MNSEAVVACINESCKSWHDNNLSLLAAALLLRHFYVPSSDGAENSTEPIENSGIHQDNTSATTLASLTTTTIIEPTSTTVLNGGSNGNDSMRPVASNTPTINNLITPNVTSTSTNNIANYSPASNNNSPPDNSNKNALPNKTSTINALIHATTTPLADDMKPPTPPLTPTNKHPATTSYQTTPATPATPTTPGTPCTPLQDPMVTTTTTTTTTDTIHHTELIPVTESGTPEFIPVNASVPTRHVKECGHNIISILQKNNFSLSTSKKVSAASQQVYVNHVYPPIDATKTVLEVIGIIKEYWKMQMAPSPLSFCGLVTYMKNLTAPTTDAAVNIFPTVSIYPPLSLCPPSPAVTPGPRRKRAKLDPGSTTIPDAGMLAQQLQTCTEQNKTLQTRLASVESDLKNIHQICVQQECELRNIGNVCLNKVPQGENDLKVVPWPYGEKIVGLNHSLWQACYSPHGSPSYWFREEQHILDVINDKDGDIICGYHVTQDILLMKVDLEWLKKSFDHPNRKADETMQHLELAYSRFDGYIADSGEVGLFPKGFAKIVRKMTLHRKLSQYPPAVVEGTGF